MLPSIGLMLRCVRSAIFGAMVLAETPVLSLSFANPIFAWWAAAPLLMSVSAASIFAWLVAQWMLRRKSRDALSYIESSRAGSGPRNRGRYFRWIFYWAFVNVFLLLASLVVAMTHIR